MVRFVPIVLNATTPAIEINPAMNAYSIAVAPALCVMHRMKAEMVVNSNSPWLSDNRERWPLECARGHRRLPHNLPAMVLKVLLRLVPTVPITVTAATAINAAIKPYSIAVAPFSLFKSALKALKMFI